MLGVPTTSRGIEMMVLCSNHSSKEFLDYVHEHKGKLGWIMGPTFWKKPRIGIPFALDNDAFIAWKTGTQWNESAWLKMIDKIKDSGQKPRWILAPDKVGDRWGTISLWHKYLPILRQTGWELAFAVQDHMQICDVPYGAVVVFVGGTTHWKWRTARMWCQHFPRVHIGRVRTKKLQLAEEMGAESVDGSGFLRETFNGATALTLRAFVEGYRDTTGELFPNIT